MKFIYKIATLKINGIAQQTHLGMLEDFLWQHDIDIVLLQEVTSTKIETISHYTKHVNIGSEQRGTAILVKEGIQIQQMRQLPTGRGIARIFGGTCIVNIYAPMGAQKKFERETFYNTDLLSLLPILRFGLLLAEDFNCVMSQSDTTGQNTTVRPSRF